MRVVTFIRNALTIAVAVIAIVESLPPLLERLDRAREKRRLRAAARRVNNLISPPRVETPF